MIKQLIIFLSVVIAIVAAMTYYHLTTPSHFNAEAFFGPSESAQPASDTKEK